MLSGKLEDFDSYFENLEPSHIIIQSHNRNQILEEFGPKYVIMYDPDVAFFRQLEIYKSENPGIPLRVYWLFFKDSVEEKRYMTSLDKEANAFETLIHSKEIMSVTHEQDGKSNYSSIPEAALPLDMLDTVNTRVGGSSSSSFKFKPLIPLKKKVLL